MHLKGDCACHVLRSSIQLKLKPPVCRRPQESDNMTTPSVAWPKIAGADGGAAGQRGGRDQPHCNAGVWLLRVILMLMLYICVKRTKANTLIITLYKRHQLPFQK